MMSAGDMTDLGKAKGPEFDRQWARMMTIDLPACCSISELGFPTVI